jgi:hypothetical protein
MTNDAVILKIRETSRKINAPEAVLLAIAHVETGGKFNADAKSKSGTYCGVFQLSDGYGGCKGNDRFDVEKATICA